MELNAAGQLYEFDSTADVYAGALVAMLIKKDLYEGKEILRQLYAPRVLDNHSLVSDFFLPEIEGEMVSFVLVKINFIIRSIVKL